MAKRPKFASLHADMIKRMVAKPVIIPGPDGQPVKVWHITEEAA
jgi:hypothetical protein